MSTPLLTSLAEVEAAAWQELNRAAHDRQHDWRTAVLATLGGSEPAWADARSVVLREVDADQRCLRLFSDSRAPKIGQLQAQPQGTLLMWSPRLSWQLRLRVTLTAETDGLAVASRWAGLHLTAAAKDYLALRPPGSVLAQAALQAAGPPVELHSADKPGAKRGHFAVITAQVLALDWLELRPQGHRRARFDSDGAAWLAP
jgi:hypothetical protein